MRNALRFQIARFFRDFEIVAIAILRFGHRSETRKWPPHPHIKGKNMNTNLDKIWPKMLHNKATSTVLRQYFCSTFWLVCEDWGFKMIPQSKNWHALSQSTTTPPQKHLWGKNFPPKDNYPLIIAFSLPWKWPIFPWNEGLEKKEFAGLRENIWLYPARENLPQAVPKGSFRTKKYYDDSKNSELLRRSVFTTPPKFTTARTLLWEEKCL